MGQNEVYELLKRKASMWFSAKQVSEELDISISSATASLMKIRRTIENIRSKDPDVLIKVVKRKGHQYYKYRWNR